MQILGREPLEHPAFAPLISALKGAGYRIEVETAGTELSLGGRPARLPRSTASEKDLYVHRR
jgi:organic radical activating enzyme